MPATNPQPFKYHPLPGLFGSKTLAAGATLETPIDNSADVQVVAPPVVEANGIVDRVALACNWRLLAAGAPLVAGDVKLVLKTTDGREVILAESAGAEDLVTLYSLYTQNVPLETLDGGLYIRVVPAAVTVKVWTRWEDARGLNTKGLDVTAVYPNKQTLLSNTEFGRTLVPGSLEEGEQVSLFENFDSGVGGDHTLRVFLTDGVDEIELDNGGIVLAGFANGAIQDQAVLVPEGWSLQVCLAEAVVTRNPRVVICAQPTNAQARSDQAGAY